MVLETPRGPVFQSRFDFCLGFRRRRLSRMCNDAMMACAMACTESQSYDKMHCLRTRTGFPMHTFMTRRSDSLAVTAQMRKPNSIPFLQRNGIHEACAPARRAPDLPTLTRCLGRDGPYRRP